MVDCVADLLEQGKLMMVAVDGIDWQSWTNTVGAGRASARGGTTTTTATSTDEVVPFVRGEAVAEPRGPPAAAWAPSTRRTSSSAAPTCSTA